MSLIAEPSFDLSLPAYSGPHWGDLLAALLIASAGALLGLLAVYAFPVAHRVFHALRQPVLTLTAGGIAYLVDGVRRQGRRAPLRFLICGSCYARGRPDPETGLTRAVSTRKTQSIGWRGLVGRGAALPLQACIAGCGLVMAAGQRGRGGGEVLMGVPGIPHAFRGLAGAQMILQGIRPLPKS